MDEKITNMQEVSQAVEQKFKDFVNDNVGGENPTSLNDTIKPDTELPETGSIPDKAVTVEEPFKTPDGVLGENTTLVTPPVENPTPETPQEKAVTGVTDNTAAITFDPEVANADDHDDTFEAALKKTEEELETAFGDLYGAMGDNSGEVAPTNEAPVETEEPKEETPVETEEVKEEAPQEETPAEEEYTEAKECDETEFKNVSIANPSSVIEEKVDHFTTVDGDKLQELNPPVVESGVNGETKELPAENPTTDVVQEDNPNTGTVGAADGADEIIKELDNLNIVADSINEGSTGVIGSGQTPEPTGEVTTNDLTNPGTESEEGEEVVEEKTVEESEGSDEYTETEEVTEETKEESTGETPTEIPAENNEVSKMDPQPVVGETGDATNLETDVDLHGDEFEKTVEEFDNIIKLETEDGKNLGEKYTAETNLITSTLDEAVQAAESARAAIAKDMAQMGFEAAMMGINHSGMEAATNPDTGFDNSGDILKDIFKGL